LPPAEYEREMIRERVGAGIRKAKASGKHIGRPKAVVNQFRVERLRAEGLSWRAIAQRMDLPRSTVYRYRGCLKPLARTLEEKPGS